MGRSVALAVSRWPGVEEAGSQSQASPYEIYDGPSGIGTGFSLSTSAFPYHYDSTTASYIFILLEGQTGEGESSKNKCSFGSWGTLDRKVLFLSKYGDFISQLYSLTKDIYIYIYVCVCVCVCVRARTHTHTRGLTIKFANSSR